GTADERDEVPRVGTAARQRAYRLRLVAARPCGYRGARKRLRGNPGVSGERGVCRMSDDLRRLLRESLDILDEANKHTERMPDASDICMAEMYINHCMKRLEEDVRND